MRPLEGRGALVTGAAAGFGAAIAARLAREGARVACVDLDIAGAERTAETLRSDGHDADALGCDVADPSSVRHAFDAVARAGPLHILVNNAGVAQQPRRFASIDAAELDRILAVNLKGLLHVVGAAVPLLRGAGAGAAVVNVSSAAALRPRPGMAWYNASKAAIVSLTQSLALELAADRIRVNAVAPALAATAMMDRILPAAGADDLAALVAAIPLRRLATPDDVASAVLFLASDEASFITGVTLPVDGGRSIA